ncbi:MAG: hypothetical protein ACRDGM_20320, partial [bacterium]
MTISQTHPLTIPQLHITQFQSWDELRHVHPAWNDLLDASSSRSAFLTLEWLRSWWGAYGGSRELVLLGCFNVNGHLVAIAPLYRQTLRGWLGLPLRVLRLVGDGSHDSDNLDFIVRVGYEAEAVRTFLDWLALQRLNWDIVELNTVPSESPVAAAFIQEVAARR